MTLPSAPPDGLFSTTTVPVRSGTRLAIVPRVSTADQEEYGTSLDKQREKLLLLGQIHDYTVHPDHDYSGDESGRIPLEQRPIMSRLLADARAQKFDAVAFFALDRMARRLKYMLQIWDALEEAGVTVLIVNPAIDTTTAVGRLIRNVLGAVAEFEVDTILERTQDGKKRKLARKEGWLTGVHYGYRYTKADRLHKVPGHISKHEGEAEQIVRMFTLRAQGWSYERIADLLTVEGIPTPRGATDWNYSTVRKIIMCRAYMGTGHWGRTVTTTSKRGKKSARIRRDGRAPIEITYPQIVSPALWEEANRLSLAGVQRQRTGPDRYLFGGGLVRCAEHGRGLYGTTNGSGHRRYRCVCNWGPKAQRMAHSLPAQTLEDAVWADLMAFLADPARGRAGATRLIAEADQRAAAAAARCRELEEKLAAPDGEALELLRLARRGTYKQEWLDASLAEVTTEQESLRSELARAQAEEALARTAIPEAEELAHICQSLNGGAAYATAEERRALLDLLQVQVTVRGKDYQITGLIPELRVQGSLERVQASMAS